MDQIIARDEQERAEFRLRLKAWAERNERAKTPEQKRAIVERILAVWLSNPDLRLGQLLANAVPRNLFYTEDNLLALKVEAFGSDSSTGGP
jgi:hypothetical protein